MARAASRSIADVSVPMHVIPLKNHNDCESDRADRPRFDALRADDNGSVRVWSER